MRFGGIDIINGKNKYLFHPFIWGIIYIELGIVFTHVFFENYYSSLKAFFALPLFFMIPYYFGYLIKTFLEKEIKIKNFADLVTSTSLTWVLGLIFIVIITNLLSQFSFWNAFYFVQIILFLSLISYVYKKNKIFSNNIGNFFIHTVILDMVLIIFLSLGFWLTAFIVQPIPLSYTHGYNYVGVALRVANNQPFILNTGYYPLTLGLLYGFTSILFNVYPLYLLSMFHLITPIFAGIGVYTLTVYGINKSRIIGILAAFLSIWTFNRGQMHYFVERSLLLIFMPFATYILIRTLKTYHDTNNQIPHFLFIIIITSTLASFFFSFACINPFYRFIVLSLPALLIILLIKIYKNIFHPIVMYTLICTGIGFIHFFEGFLVVGIVMIIYIYYYYISLNKRYIPSIIAIFTIILSFTIIVCIRMNIDFLTSLSLKFNESVLLSSQYDFTSKNYALNIVGPQVIVLIFYLSTIFSFTDKDILPFTMASWIFLSAYFLPIDEAGRFSHYLNVYVGILSAWFIVFICKVLNRVYKSNLFSVFSLTIIIILISQSVFIVNNNFIDKNLNYDNHLTRYSLSEVKAAEWILENTPKYWDIPPIWIISKDDRYISIEYPKFASRFVSIQNSKDTLILSDPYTMIMMEGLTGREQPIIERAWVNPKAYSNKSLKIVENIKSILCSSTSEEAYNKIASLNKNHSTILIIISKRTNTWLEGDEIFVWYPDNKINKKYLEIFDNENLFIEVYRNKDVVIYKVTENSTLDVNCP